jgi:PAS domain S-box-containing protein
MHILLIDDDAEDRMLIARLIQRDHPQAEILHVDSEKSLERHLQAGHVDLAVIDHTLRWSAGLDVFRRVKAADPDSATIMYSGEPGEEHAVEAIKAGLDDYIVKGAEHQPRLRTAIHALLPQGERRRRMRRTQQRYEELFQRVTVGLFACDAGGRFVDANPALLTMLGAAALDDLRDRRFSDVFSGAALPQMPPDRPASGVSDMQVRVRRNDGEELTGLLNAYPSRDGENRIEGVLTNVTALKKALDEKTALLREVYHRVYNNLQLVISLLGMQARRFQSEDVHAGFREVMDRVRSLSLVQQKLYRTETYSAVDFSAYLRDLANSLVPPALHEDIALVFDLAPLLLPMEKAVPLGLIANELLMNAVKHAFPDARKGEIRVRLAARPGNRAAFSIVDNGIGVHPSEMADSNGVGARLIQQLALQADAKVTITSDRGFAADVEFRAAES